MRKEASLPVRLDPEDKRRLQAAADRMGLTISALVRLLVRSFVDEYDRCGGRVAMPPEWRGQATPDASAAAAAEGQADYKG
jgi:hypothetical protein